MKKKILVFGLLLVLLLCVTSAVYAQFEFLDCCIMQTGISSSGFNDNVLIKVADVNGVENTYTCDTRVRINGVIYKNSEDILNTIALNSFAKIAIDNGVVKVINFDTNSKDYENVRYNDKKKAFNVLNANNSGLPVYYSYNNNLTTPHFDENHIYDISVYDYGVLVTDMRSDNDSVVLKLIELNPGINSGFTQNIGVYCETDQSDRLVLKCAAYDKNSNLVVEREGMCSGDCEVVLDGFENKDAVYTVKLWLEDTNGNIKSHIYKKLFTTKKIDVINGYIMQAAIDSSAVRENVQIKITDENGIQKVYTCADRVRIDGRMYKDNNDILNSLYTDVFGKMAVEDGYVTVINFGTDYTSYENVSYDESQQKFECAPDGLPVYYQYNEAFALPHVDKNHKYDIAVYDYAVLITDMKSADESNVLKLIELGSGINAEFMQNINIYCETDCEQDAYLKCEAYDNNSQLVAKSEARCSGDAETSLVGFENKDSEYTVKLWLEDVDGNKISNVYIKQFETEQIEVKNGYIIQTGIDSSSFEENVLIKLADQKGIEKSYKCAERVRINGRMYRNIEDISAQLTSDVFCKMAIEDGYVTVINFGTSFSEYQSVSYDESAQCFEGLKQLSHLPVYYQYDGYFAVPYLDENHVYDLKVYDTGVLITDINSKNDMEVIKLIEPEYSINREFRQTMNIYCETEINTECIFKGEVYDKNGHKIFKGESYFNGCGDIVLEMVKGNKKAQTVKLWLEDNNGNIISNVYTLNADKKQNKTVYGDVVISYTYENDEGEKQYISVKDVNGKEKIYECDSDMLVVDNVSIFSVSSEPVEIPENAFVKLGVDDNVIKVVQIGSDDVELSHSDFVFENNSLDGNVCIINNTADTQQFKCYTAVFDENDCLKDVSIESSAVNSGENAYIYPQFDNYSGFSSGDYVKVFAWNSLNGAPLVEMAAADIN